ncbi:hypothetical protein PT7_1879 [Pusillimonas sp. T7-7]|uniref:hypothetical protein n=1 Tax=Pusillimonas sp. (strain T7-7) TaxID=1007105 RepID=UPI0002084778|nr:hypothetical protein [Pusillimonas sp. T7-7]AEC20419.1 hypothetical protein PT7_1879 [Pusillimonas sp. T7-7]
MLSKQSRQIHDAEFSLVRNDPFYRLQRRIGLIPANGDGFKRRAIVYALVAWLPLVITSWLAGTVVESAGIAEPLLGHIGIHVRCLVAIPLLILAEGLAQRTTPLFMHEFRRTGLISEAQTPQFEQVLANMLWLRKQALPWIIIIGLVVTWTAAFLLTPNRDEIQWAGSENRSLAFGAWWFLLVTRPIFSVLLLAWIWRLLLLGILLFRIARLPLQLVAMHPDRFAGLGFLDRIPLIYSPFIFAVSAVMAGAWAHSVFYHAVPVPSLYVQMATLLIVLVAVGLAPLLVFTPMLLQAKKKALLDYGVLLARHGRAVDARWIAQQDVPDYPMLNAPELGPVADIQALYQSVASMRPVIINKSIIAKIVLPAALPLLVLVATQWPLKSTLSKLLFTLL